MEWISNWVQGIIVAVIIGTIIEMILPEGTSKKYIKVVIGTYILFSIISPVVTKISKKNFKLSNIFDLNEYIEASTSNTTYENMDNAQQKQILTLYETNLKQDMKEKIEAKGYKVQNIQLKVENTTEYKVNNLSIIVTKQTKKQDKPKENTSNIAKVEEIQIKINEKNNEIKNEEKEQEKLSESEKRELQEYLSSVYEIQKENIIIN